MSDKDIEENPATTAAGEPEKVVTEKAATEKAATEKAVSEKAVSEQAATEKAVSEQAATEKDATAKVAADEVGTVSTEKAASTAAKKEDAAATGSGVGGFVSRLRPGRKGAIALRAAVALLLGASMAASVYYFFQDRASDGQLAAQEQARSAACAYAPVLADYDAKNLDPYFAAVLAGATGDWKTQFGDTSKELKEVLSQGQVVSKVDDVQCAIKSGDEHSAEAIVVIGQTITSLGTQGKPAPGQLSMVMRMTNVDGKWLVNKVNSPLAPSATP